MKMLDSENTRLGRELAELQGRLALGERAEKESRRETLGLRQRLLKGEASLEVMRQEVTEQAGGLVHLSSLQQEAGRLPNAETILKGHSLGLVPSPTP